MLGVQLISASPSPLESYSPSGRRGPSTCSMTHHPSPCSTPAGSRLVSFTRYLAVSPSLILSVVVDTSSVPPAAAHASVESWAWTRGAVTAHSNAVSVNVKDRTKSERRERGGRVGFRAPRDIMRTN